MLNRKLVVSAVMCATLACACASVAQSPPVDIGRRHGNLKAAQELIDQAFQRIGNAQQDNNDQLGGHAQRAKDLLRQASAELKLAAETSNSEGR